MGVVPVWTVKVGERAYYLRDLPIGVLERITPSWSVAIAAPLMDLRTAEALYHAAHDQLCVPRRRYVSARTLMQAFEAADDDLPSMWVDGVPDDAQRDSDAWIATLCRPPYCFTPKQVREEFTVRDLLVLRDAAESRDV